MWFWAVLLADLTTVIKIDLPFFYTAVKAVYHKTVLDPFTNWNPSPLLNVKADLAINNLEKNSYKMKFAFFLNAKEA